MRKEKAMKKVAIVTGASRGIGKAVAERLAKDGFAVVVNYVSNAPEAEQVVAGIKAQGGEAIAMKADVGDAGQVEHLFAQTLEKWGSINVVVQNSGIMPLSPIGKGDAEIFDKVISVNLRGTFLVLAQAAQHISSGGRIIAFSSSVLTKSFPTYGPYIASKAGRSGADCDGSFPEGEERGANRRINEDESPGAHGATRRYRERRFVLGRPRWGLDQFTSGVGKRRLCLLTVRSHSETIEGRSRDEIRNPDHGSFKWIWRFDGTSSG